MPLVSKKFSEDPELKIGILQTGRSPEQIRDKHGDYDDLFKNLLAGRGFDFVTYPVLDGVLPTDTNEADGWLITGSKFGVYEDHDWIPPLEDFIRRSYAAGTPIIGVCFGHQVMAQALGGKVEKFSGGWSVGAVNYQFTDKQEPQTVMAWHQDQVVEKPADAKVIGSSDFCQNAMLLYGNKALSIQPHPEFTAGFVADLLTARKEVLPKHIADMAEQSLTAPLTSDSIADTFEAFFKQKRDD